MKNSNSIRQLAEQKSNLSGFTFIEVLITVAVIFIVISITFAGYARLNQRQTLISAGQTMKNLLRDAQSRTYNGEVDCNTCDCNTGDNFEGWYADFVSKSIYGQCVDNLRVTRNFSEKSFSLPENISITVAPSNKILFRSNPIGVDNVYTICMSDEKLPDSYYKINVNASGEIVDSGGLIPTCPL